MSRRINFDQWGEEFFVQDVFGQFFSQRPEEIIVTEVKRAKEKAVYRYQVRLGESRETVLFGIVYQDQKTGERFFKALQYLNSQVFKKEGTVPRAYLWDQKQSFLLMSAIQGRRLREELLNQAQGLVLVGRVGKILARMQLGDWTKFDFSFSKKATLDKMRQSGEHQLKRVQKILPSFWEEKKGFLEKRLEFQSKFFSQSRLSFSHNDFCADNLVVKPNGQIGIIDFSDAAVLDEAADLASFVLRLKMQELGFPRVYQDFRIPLAWFENYQREVLRAYCQEKGIKPEEIKDRVFLWQTHYGMNLFNLFFDPKTKRSAPQWQLWRYLQECLEKLTS